MFNEHRVIVEGEEWFFTPMSIRRNSGDDWSLTFAQFRSCSGADRVWTMFRIMAIPSEENLSVWVMNKSYSMKKVGDARLIALEKWLKDGSPVDFEWKEEDRKFRDWLFTPHDEVTGSV